MEHAHEASTYLNNQGISSTTDRCHTPQTGNLERQHPNGRVVGKYPHDETEARLKDRAAEVGDTACVGLSACWGPRPRPGPVVVVIRPTVAVIGPTFFVISQPPAGLVGMGQYIGAA